MVLDVATIGQWLGTLLWPLMRIGAFIMVAPVFGAQLVSVRIRVAMILVLSVAVAPHLPSAPAIDLISAQTVLLAAQQILIGVALGFILQILMQVLIVAGQIIAFQMGLGFASMVDPSNGVSVPVISQFYLMLVTLLFLVSNGHLVAIDVLVASFEALPVGEFPRIDSLWLVANLGSWMFAAATLIALPAIVSLLIVNSAMGILTRAAPQLNIFAVGFPMTILLGLVVIFLSLSGVLPHFERISGEALAYMSLLHR